MSILSATTLSSITHAAAAPTPLPPTTGFGITRGSTDQQANVAQLVALLTPIVMAAISPRSGGTSGQPALSPSGAQLYVAVI